MVGTRNVINMDAWQIKKLVQNTHDADVQDSPVRRCIPCMLPAAQPLREGPNMIQQLSAIMLNVPGPDR